MKPTPKAQPMTEIDIEDDEALRYIQRVLESSAPQEDRDRAAQMVRDIRTRIRKAYAASGVPGTPHQPSSPQGTADPIKEGVATNNGGER